MLSGQWSIRVSRKLTVFFPVSGVLSRLDHMVRPVLAAVMVHEGLFAHWGADHLLGPTSSTMSGSAARMVHFHVIYYKVVDQLGVDHLAYALDEVIFERFLDRIEERDFFVYYQVGVISSSLRSGVTMKVANVPVQGATQ